jgi:hypothetical protein
VAAVTGGPASDLGVLQSAPVPAEAPAAATPEQAPAHAPEGSSPPLLVSPFSVSRVAGVVPEVQAAQSTALVFALVLAIFAFLALQGTLDRRDPKLVDAPEVPERAKFE